MKKLSVTKRKAIVGAAAILGSCTLLCGGITQLALTTETSKVEKVPTNYSAASSPDSQDAMKGYTKANYKVVVSPNSSALPKNSVSAEQAAEIGAQNIWKFFGTSLEGKTIEVQYHKMDNVWTGWVELGERRTPTTNVDFYHFFLDPATGALLDIQLVRTLPGPPLNLPEDPSRQSNFQQYLQPYLDRARADIEKLHLFSGKTQSVCYSGYGSGGNDLSISITARSSIGEEISLSYSRKDQTLLQYSSNESRIKAQADFEKSRNPELDALIAKNQAKLDPNGHYVVQEDENGYGYVNHINEKGQTERLLISHTTYGR